jgi:hypothetical protein
MEQIGARYGIIYKRIKKSYDTYKYTKVCGGGSCKSNASTEGS